MAKQYRVVKTNALADEEGRIFKEGDTITLGSKLARKFNKLGFLGPILEDDDEENSDEGSGSEPEASETEDDGVSGQSGTGSTRDTTVKNNRLKPGAVKEQNQSGS